MVVSIMLRTFLWRDLMAPPSMRNGSLFSISVNLVSLVVEPVTLSCFLRILVNPVWFSETKSSRSVSSLSKVLRLQ